MWEAAATASRPGGAVHLDLQVVRMDHDGSAVIAFIAANRPGRFTHDRGTHFLSTMPLRDLIALDPPAPAEARTAAEPLTYRDFLDGRPGH